MTKMILHRRDPNARFQEALDAAAAGGDENAQLAWQMGWLAARDLIVRDLRRALGPGGL